MTINENFDRSLSFDRLMIKSCLVEPAALKIQSQYGVCTVEPKVMAMLQVLAERPQETWTRAELIERIWPQSDGGDESLTRLAYLLRKAFADTHQVHDLVKTVPKQGYYLSATVDREAVSQAGEIPGAARPAVMPSRALDLSPFSLCVLPVTEIGDTKAYTLLCDGITRDLSALLSRSSALEVAAPSSTAYLAANRVAFSKIAQALNVRYLVNSTFSVFEDEITIRVELVDSVSERLVWSKKYTAGMKRFYALQDEIVLDISTAVASKVKASHRTDEFSFREFSLGAYERVQQAKNLRANYGPATARQIEALLVDALAIEPDNPLIKAELAVQLSQNVVSKWTDDEDATRALANRLVAEALAAQPSDPDVLAAAGIVSTMFHDPDTAIGYLDRVIRLDPISAHAAAVLGWQQCLRHADPTGLEKIRTSEMRAPHHPRFGLWATYRCTAHLFMLDYEAAEPACRDAIIRTPNYYQPRCSLAWALCGLGQYVDAKAAIDEAKSFGDEDIAIRFVDEMRKWSSNSPHAEEISRVLDKLLDLSASESGVTLLRA